MQSSFNVIKNDSVKKNDEKCVQIQTSYIPVKKLDEKIEENAKAHIDSYENLAKTMLENARRKSEEIISNAYSEASRIEQEAYQKGIDKGYKEGYKKGHDEEYDKAAKECDKMRQQTQMEYDEAIVKANSIIEAAEAVLRNAKEEYNTYLGSKKEEIKDIVSVIVDRVLRREINNEDAFNEIVNEIITSAKNSKMFIIRCSGRYSEELRKIAKKINEQYSAKKDITVIEDNSIEEGKVTIEKDNGSIIVSVDEALSKIDELL